MRFNETFLLSFLVFLRNTSKSIESLTLKQRTIKSRNIFQGNTENTSNP